MRFLICRFFATCALAGVFHLGSAQAQSTVYQPPDISKLGFDATKITLTPSSRAAAARLLISNVSEVDPVFDAKLVGLALAIDPGNFEAKQANQNLVDRTPVKRLQPPNPLASAKYFAELASFFRTSGGVDNEKIGALFANLALRFDHENKRAQQEAKLLPEVAWPFVPGGEEDAAELTPVKTEAKAYALSVLRKNDLTQTGSRLELTIKCEPFAGGKVTFGENIGEHTKSSAKNAMRVLGSLRPGVPQKFMFDVAIKSDNPVDGESAGTAMTLLMFSLFDKVPLEEKLAVTGEIMPNGTVGIVGGVAYKLSGAQKAGTKVVAIPLKNSDEVIDFAILESPEKLWDMHVFTYNSFPELLQVARTERPESIKKAMALFEETRVEYRANPSQKSKAYQRLNEVVKLAPNHASARALARLISSAGQPSLSFFTSVNEIDRLGWQFAYVVAAAKYEMRIRPADLNKLKNELEAFQQKADPKVATWVTTMTSVINDLQKVQDPSQLPQQLDAVAYKVQTLSATVTGAIGQQAMLVEREREKHGAK